MSARNLIFATTAAITTLFSPVYGQGRSGEATSPAQESDAKQTADAVARRDKEWDVKMCDGFVAIADAAAGIGDLNEAQSKFPAKTECKKDTSSVTCGWRDLTEQHSRYDGTRWHSSRPSGDFEYIDMPLNTCLTTKRGAKIVDGWSMPNGDESDHKHVIPFARRRYLIERGDGRSFLDSRLQSGDDAWAFHTTLSLKSYHNGSEPPFLERLAGSPSIELIAFDTLDSLTDFVGKAIDDPCVKKEEFPLSCRIDAGSGATFWMERFYSPIDATVGIHFHLNATSAYASASKFHFGPAVEKQILPLLSPLGLSRKDVETCTTFTPDDPTEHLYTDPKGDFQLSCKSRNEKGKTGYYGLYFTMTSHLKATDLANPK
jgi:hypothetical protein